MVVEQNHNLCLQLCYGCWFNNNNIRLMIKLDKTRETLKFEVNIQETIYKVTVC
jgi:hypothetical protein